MTQLVAQARSLGLAPEQYAKELVEDSLALRRKAESMSIAKIMQPVRKTAVPADEAEIVLLVANTRAAAAAADRISRRKR